MFCPFRYFLPSYNQIIIGSHSVGSWGLMLGNKGNKVQPPTSVTKLS